MSYSYSSDPRLKRPASKSPDAHREPKRSATLGVRDTSPAVASNNTIARPNGAVSSPAHVATMTSKSQNASIVDLKTQINLQTITTMSLQLKFEHAETQVKTAEADYQSHSNKGHFTAFPAIEETKTAAVERAKRALKAARDPLESARAELHRLTESLVDLEQSVKAPTQDVVSRAEFEELKGYLNGIKADIGNVTKDLSSARESINDFKANQDVTSRAVEDFRRNMDSHAMNMNATRSIPALPANMDPSVVERLDVVESDVKDLEADIANVNQVVASFVMEALKAPNEALSELKQSLQSTQSLLGELQQGQQQTDENKTQLRDALGKVVDEQHTNAEALQGCLDRLDKIEPQLDQAAGKGELVVVKQSLEQLSEAVESVKATQENAILATELPATNGATNGATSGLSSFRPVLGGNDEDDISPFQSRPTIPGSIRKFDDKDLMQMKLEIESLKFKVQDQTNRYNNLLTDQLAQNMLDNMGAVYPNLKEAERVAKSVHEMHARLGILETNLNEMNARTGTIANRVELVDNKAVTAHQAAGKDISKLREDLTVLSGRVDQHTKDVESGRVMLQEHAAALEKSKDELEGVKKWITNREEG